MDGKGDPPSGGDRNLGPVIIWVNIVVLTASTLILVNITGMGFVAAEVENGLGRHRYYLKPGAYKKYLKYPFASFSSVSQASDDSDGGFMD
ncbi:MAG: hypothetical protein Q9197_002019 [Variospora fuerteventurae]